MALGESSETPTGTASPATPAFAPSHAIDGARFAAGIVLAGRYRVVGLLGKGGMGEVYRADDLTLGQAVALKFLPPALAHDPDRLARFHGEVRIARQVSHPNVCRMYDIGEANGLRFLSMEYVDGEDLASLLKRIGRLPGDKAIEIARQLCAGLAAAHDKGIVHRDLKPANVMIDGRGKVRITDFGLASVAADLRGDEVRAGTPTHMAPEQLAGREVTVKSDLYALGLVLYEICTGNEAYSARTPQELSRMHAAATPATPSSVIPEMDPLLERVIMRCLEKDPRDRPASALAVAAALPGGDPLAAALAAGETPSPEMVAASGEAVAVKPVIALACMGALLLGLVLAGHLSWRAMLPLMVPMEKPPEVLAHRAGEVVRAMGYQDPPADRQYGFGAYVSYLRFLAGKDSSPSRWDKLATERPEAIFFWYQQSPLYLDHDASPLLSGRIDVVLDSSGRLRDFSAVPIQVEEGGGAAEQPDWSDAFRQAGLDIAAFSPTDPKWVPPAYADTRTAWQGAYPGLPQTKLRVEAASYRGRPVYFQVVDEWTRAARISPLPPAPATKVSQGIVIVLFLLVITAGVLLARHNLRLGRGDRRGALRIAAYLLLCHILVWALRAHHLPSLTVEGWAFIDAVGDALFFAAQVWLFYVALEPYVRRRWPETLISWSRLLAGKLSDPMVGRDVLAGAVIGVGRSLMNLLSYTAHAWIGQAPPLPLWGLIETLQSFRIFAAKTLDSQLISIEKSIGLLFGLIGLYILVRRKWLAVAVIFSILFVMAMPRPEGGVLPIKAAAVAASLALLVLALLRWGLLAALVCEWVNSVILSYPIALDLSAWWAPGTIVTLLLPVLLAVYAVRATLAGRPVFQTAMFRE